MGCPVFQILIIRTVLTPYTAGHCLEMFIIILFHIAVYTLYKKHVKRYGVKTKNDKQPFVAHSLGIRKFLIYPLAPLF